MKDIHYSPLPAIEHSGAARWVALGTAATVLLGGCSMISEAAEQPYVQKQIEELRIDKTQDFTRNAACKTPDVAANSQVVAAAAERCITFGMKDADLVIVDMTDADEKLKPFAKELAKDVQEATDGYITVKPRIIQPNMDTQTRVNEITRAGKCAPIGTYKNLLSIAAIQNTDGLKAVPYVVVVSDHKSCSGGVIAVSDSISGNTVLEFKDSDPEFSSLSSLHEMGHLWGFGHQGGYSKPINNTEWPYYSFSPEDMPEDMLDLETFFTPDTTYTEYGLLCRNMMGATQYTKGIPCPYDVSPRLSAQQDYLLHWPDRAKRKDYENLLHTVDVEPVRLSPSLKEIPQAKVRLNRTYTVANENGIFELDGMLIEAISAPSVNSNANIEGILVSLTTEQNAQTAVLGVLDTTKAMFPYWTIKVAYNQYVHLQIDKGGDLLVMQTDSKEK